MPFNPTSHQIFSLFHRDWYESLERYQPGDELLQIVRALLPATWRLTRKGPWFHVSPDGYRLPRQGWKIHVSATLINCEEILRQTAAFCVEQEIAFKFFLDTFCVSLCTSKIWSREASGKYITIYPQNEQHFCEIIEALSLILHPFTGPYILSDKRYKDSKVLHYRYGGIIGVGKLSVTGVQQYMLLSPQGVEVPDQRAPYWNPPVWVSDPFEPTHKEAAASKASAPTLKEGRYLIEQALQFSVCGGVYLAHDTQTGDTVIIKEARRYVNLDTEGQDAADRLCKEHEILQKLQPTGITPSTIDLFWDWEHLFLVEEHIPGPHLARFMVAFSPLIKKDPEQQVVKDYIEKLKLIWSHIADGIAALHEMGIIYQDFSLKNIIVSDLETGAVRFIDLEAAWQEGVDRPTNVITPGFASPSQEKVVGKMHDMYAFGAIMLGMLFPIHPVLAMEPEIKQRFLSALRSDFGLVAQIPQLIERCMHDKASERFNPQQVSAFIQHMPVHGTDDCTQIILPVPHEELLKVISATTKYIRESADVRREDRLFPADPTVFSTNALSVAYGAAGVVYALSLIDGEVPAQIRSWLLSRTIHQDHIPPGLYLGSAGIAWVLWEIGLHDVAVQTLDSAFKHPLLWERADIFYGAAGYGLTCLRFYLATREPLWLDRAICVGEWLLATKKAVPEQGYCWPDKDGNVRLGYAQGASGIACYLLYLALLTDDTRFLQASHQALAFDLSHLKRTDDGNLSVPRGNVGAFDNVVLPYWLNGSAGIATVLLRFWAYSGESKYLELLDQLIPDTAHKYTVFPGLFQGLSGLGNFLLDAYQFTGKELYLQEAHRTAQGVLLYTIQRPQGIAFPGEQLLRISTDFGTGSAGIALFLQRMAHEKQQSINFNFTLDHLLAATLRMKPPLAAV